MTEQGKFATYDEATEKDGLVGYRSRSRSKGLFRCSPIAIGLMLVLVVLVVLLIAALGIGIGVGVQSTSLYDSVRIENLVSHLQSLEEIAKKEANSNSRAVMFGYNESAEMVYDKLYAAGYRNITRQMFPVATYEDNENHILSAVVPPLTYNFKLGSRAQFNVMRYSGSTNEQLLNGTISNVSGFGCSTDDYTADTVAIIDYVPDQSEAGCSLFQMANEAKSARVLALIMARRETDVNKEDPPNARIYNQTVDDFEVVDLPLIGVNYQVGQILRLDETTTVSLLVNMTVDMTYTYNILAYTDKGYDSDIIVVGSHLDSVNRGPGINDNGSGSMANLEIALQLIGTGTSPVNQVLFAFWGAEEWGLLGSTYFVMALSEEQRGDYALNLNFDMIASPNYKRQVYEGAEAENEQIVNASTTIQKLFEERFRSLELEYDLTSFNGRSDYGPFIVSGVDIPAGGLFTGADEKKTADERNLYGGLAGASLDPCYHQYCDTVDNIDQEVYEQMAQVAAYVLDTLMMQEDLRSFLDPDTDTDY